MSERYINNLTGDFSICFSEHLTEHPIKYIVCSVWLLSESFHVSVKHFNLSVIMPLDRLYEEDDVIAFCF